MSALTPSGRAADLVVLLTVTFAGRPWRFASRGIDIVDADGTWRRFSGGIDAFDFEDAFELLADSPGLKTLPFSVIWPEDIARLIALGHDLGAATAEVALWAQGVSAIWDDRLVLLEGNVIDPGHGQLGEPVSFSVEENAFEDTSLLVDPTAIVTAGVTWTAPDDDAATQPYPWVFGAPGPFISAAGGAGLALATPALFVETGGTKLLLLADRPTEAAGGPGIAASVVRIYDVTDGLQESFTASLTTDLTGRSVTVVDVTAAGTITPTAGHEYWASWIGGGGAWNRSHTRALTGAGEIIREVLSGSTLRIDAGRTAVAAAFLDRFRLAGYADGSCSRYDWLRDNVIPLLPVSMTSGPDGIYPAVWRYDARAEDAVAHLVDGEGLSRSGGVEYEGRDQVVNEVSLAYALDKAAGAYLRKRTIHGGATVVADWWSSTHARTSFSRYGRRALALTTDVVYETATADLILSWLVMARGCARRVIPYDCDNRWSWLRKGDVVTLTSTPLHLRAQLALVRRTRRTFTGLGIDLVLVEDIVRDLHS